MGNKGAIRRRKMWRRLPPPSARHFSARVCSSIRRTPFQMFPGFDEFGTHLEPNLGWCALLIDGGAGSVVVEDADELGWLDQYGSMDDVVNGVESYHDETDGESVEVEW